MKKVLQSMSGFVAAAFGIAVLALLMSLTYGALQRLFPGNFMNQMWGLVMFDIAAMCWALMFVFQSKSTGQYATSALGFITGFLGTLLMVGFEVVSSGQSLAQVNLAEWGKWVVYGFVIVTALHAILIYAHHGLAPEIAEQISVGVARGEVVTKAIEDAAHTIEAEKHELSRAIYHDIVSQVKRDLGMAPIEGTVFDRRRYEQTAPIPEEVKAMYAPGTQFTDGTSNPLPITPANQAGAPDNYGPLWKNSTDVAPTLEAYAWECLNCEGHNRPHTPNCLWCGKPRTNGSPVTAFADLPPTPKAEAAKLAEFPLSQRFRDWVNSLRQPAPQPEPTPEPTPAPQDPPMTDTKPEPAGSQRPLYNDDRHPL